MTNAIDGVFDVDVLAAVKQFQSAYAYPTDGVLIPGMQKALEYEAERVNRMFADTGCDLEATNGTMTMAHTNVDAVHPPARRAAAPRSRR